MRKISNIETKKLEDLYKLNKLTELEQETKKLLQLENNNILLLNISTFIELSSPYVIKISLLFLFCLFIFTKIMLLSLY